MACSSAIYDLCILQRATFKTSLTLTDESGSFLNITSWSFSGSIRENVSAPTVITSFSCSVTSVASASIEISLTPWQTELLTRKKYVYDIIATNITPSPIEVYRIMEGEIEVSLGVTDV